VKRETNPEFDSYFEAEVNEEDYQIDLPVLKLQVFHRGYNNDFKADLYK